MKVLLYLALAGTLATVAITEADAQIRDNEASTHFLAAQCAASGGGVAGNYTDYSRKLAKTIALLEPKQQERVFGFVPQPVAFNRPEDVQSPGGGIAQGIGNGGSSEENVGNIGMESGETGTDPEASGTAEASDPEASDPNDGRDFWDELFN